MATVIFIGAHQDDDTLIMGAGIVNHKNAGHTVYYSVITDGCGSSVQDDLGMSDATFKSYRDAEMSHALTSMHISKIEASNGRLSDGTLNPNAYLGNDLRTGHVNMTVVDRVRNVIQQAASLTGVAMSSIAVKTHAHDDPHPDHMAVCQAVLYLKDQGEISDVRLYVHTNCWYGSYGGHPSATTLGASEETCPQVIWLRDALLSYIKTTTMFNGYPGTAAYGIGQLSAPDLFQPSWDGQHGYYYTPPAVTKDASGWYDNMPVQKVTVATPLYQSASTGSTVLMNMGVNEAIITALTASGSSSFRKCIGGKIGQSNMIEGYILDANCSMIRATTTVKTRQALTAWNNSAKSSSNGTIPSGATLKAAGGQYASDVLHAYDGGKLVHIAGYTPSGGSYIAKDCYVETNWTSGSTSSYYVYFV